MSCVQKEQTTMFQDAVSAAGGRIEHDRCQRQMKEMITCAETRSMPTEL